MSTPEYVWYAAYGSNLDDRRMRYYREGGNPVGTIRHYPGFRDHTPPLKTSPLTLPGTIYFAWESPVWTGGVAFYAHQPADGWPRGAAARGYLLTRQQFSDLQTQEMYRVPGEHPDLSLDEVLTTGRAQLGPGRYETLLHVGNLGGWPILTFTSLWDPTRVELRKPAARYLGMLASGLAEAHRWTAEQIVDYLAELPGVKGFWAPDPLRELVRAAIAAGSPL